MKKINGFPTNFGYSCGIGKRVENKKNDRIEIFENDAHTAIDLTGEVKKENIWEQFYYEDFASRGKCQREAEKRFNRLKKYLK